MAFDDLSTTKEGGDGGANLQNQQQAQQSQAGAISGVDIGFTGPEFTGAGSIPFQGQGAAGAGGAGGGVGGPDNVTYNPQNI
jgi:hypothetical protein